MKTNTGDGATNVQQIASQEAELQALLTRVMEAPLDPLVQRMAQLEQRLQTVEKICSETQDTETAIFAVIRGQGDELKKLKSLRGDIGDDVAGLLHAGLASMPQDVAQLRMDHTSVRSLLGEMQQGQTALLNESISGINAVGTHARLAAEESGKAVASIGDSRETIGNMLGDIRADARTEQEKLGNSIIALNEELRLANSRIEEAAPAQVRAADNLKTHIERIFNTFQTQSESARKDEMAQLKHSFQSRLWWVAGICGLSLLTNIWMVVRRLS